MYPLLPFSLNQPLAVDNAISTIGVIHKLIKKINEVIEEVNNIDSKANEYTDSQIELLNTQLRAYINELNTITINHFTSVDNAILSNTHSIEQLENDISTLHTSFNNLAVSVTEQINNSINAIKSYVDLQIEIVKQLIDAQNPEVIDCFGNKNKLQVAYNNMFSAFKYGHGEGRFDKVLNVLKTFRFSSYVDMSTVTFLQFYTNVKNATVTSFSPYIFYQGSSNSSYFSTQSLKTFKDLITNINAVPLLIYKYGYYNNTVPSTETTAFTTEIRSQFFTGSQYTPIPLLNSMSYQLRY